MGGSTANSISAANDMVSLAPKWLNIKRGQFIACTIGGTLSPSIEIVSLTNSSVGFRPLEGARLCGQLCQPPL
jgi:hypothetical protein